MHRSTEHDADFSFLKLISKTELTVIHNHPSLSPFSPDDVDMAEKYNYKIKEFRVVCGDNVYFVNPTICTPTKYRKALLEASIYVIDKNIGLDPYSTETQYAAMWVFLLSNYDGIIQISDK